MSSLLQGTGAKFVVANASKLVDSSRVPDFNTWVQCFAIYAAVLIAKSPERAPFLPAICLLWPNSARLLYDRKFCREAAESGRMKVDGGFHSYCFIGQGVDGPPWCGPCRSLDHFAASCPVRRLRRQSWCMLKSWCYNNSI